MKNARQLGAASALAFVLTLSTFAGEISTTLQPQPTPTPVTMEADVAADVDGEISTTATSSDSSVVETTLDLVLSVLALF